MRGLACVLMFQSHCYSSWLTPEARKSSLYQWSQLLGTLPAPLFIFLSGISLALVTEKLREKGAGRGAIAKKTILRGAEIFGLGILFRVQEFVLGYPISPWTDLLRVDVLNILGVSMILMAVLCWMTSSRSGLLVQQASLLLERNSSRNGANGQYLAHSLQPRSSHSSRRRSGRPPPGVAALAAGVVSRWRPRFRPPQPWLFPIFPWVAFAFTGLAVGFFLLSDFAKRKETSAFLVLGGAGVLACALAAVFDAGPIRLYDPAIYDYWHTSPSFFLMRCGILLMILFLAYAWCRWGFAQRGFSPIIQLGQTSLLVYWVHIEFVYGRLSILPKGRCSIATATTGLVIIFVAMLALSIARTRWKNRTAKVLRPDPPAVAATAESV